MELYYLDTYPYDSEKEYNQIEIGVFESEWASKYTNSWALEIKLNTK